MQTEDKLEEWLTAARKEDMWPCTSRCCSWAGSVG